MIETTTITGDEIEAVAAKIDADRPLDEHDKLVLRGIFLLAGEAAAGLADDIEVEGFDLGAGALNTGFVLNLHFDPPLPDDADVHKTFSAGQRLSRSCCRGEHIKQGTITM